MHTLTADHRVIQPYSQATRIGRSFVSCEPCTTLGHTSISTDSKTFEWFLDHTKVLFYRLHLHWTLALDKYDMSIGLEDMTAAGTYKDFLMENVLIMEKAVTNHNNTLFLDTDVVFFSPDTCLLTKDTSSSRARTT